MVAIIEKRKVEAEEAQKRKAEHTKRMQLQVVESNKAAQKIKAEERAKVKVEDDKVAQYLQEKAGREEKIEEEKLKRHEAKQLEFAKMRDAQTKTMDTRADRDAMLARRAQEAAERKWRQQEKEKALRRARDAADTQATLKAQMLAK